MTEDASSYLSFLMLTPLLIALLRFHHMHVLSILFLFKANLFLSLHYLFHIVCLFEKAFPLQT